MHADGHQFVVDLTPTQWLNENAVNVLSNHTPLPHPHEATHLRIIILDAPITPNKRPPTPRRPLPPKQATPPLARIPPLPRRAAPHAKQHRRNEEAHGGRPRKPQRLLPHPCHLPGLSPPIPPLHHPRRNQARRDGLEQRRQRRVHRGHVGAQPRAQRQRRRQQREHGEDERDHVEGEGEAAEVVVVVCADEGRGHADGGVEVVAVRRVEGERGHDGAAVGVAVGAGHAADAEEGPAGRVAGVGDAARGGLQEVDLVDWVVLRRAGEDDEELEEDASG